MIVFGMFGFQRLLFSQCSISYVFCDIYIYIYIYIYLFIGILSYLYIHIYVYIYFYMYLYNHIYIYIYILRAARSRSRHRAISMNVAKHKSKSMIRKCIRRESKVTKRKPNSSQRDARRERKGANRINPSIHQSINQSYQSHDFRKMSFEPVIRNAHSNQSFDAAFWMTVSNDCCRRGARRCGSNDRFEFEYTIYIQLKCVLYHISYIFCYVHL